MSKRNAEYVHFANWDVPPDYSEPVVVLVTWWEPDMGTETYVYHDGPSALKAISSQPWNHQFMSELDDEYEVHDDVTIRVMAF